MSKRKKQKQMTIPGTERKEIPEIEAAAEAYREVRDERCELSKQERLKKLELLALMRAHKCTLYRYSDEEGEEHEVAASEDPKVKLRKVETEVIEESATKGSTVSDDPDVHPGLIKGALDAQAEANVEENDEGDIVVRESSGGRKPMTKAQRDAKNKRDRDRRAKAKKGGK